MMQNNTW